MYSDSLLSVAKELLLRFRQVYAIHYTIPIDSEVQRLLERAELAIEQAEATPSLQQRLSEISADADRYKALPLLDRLRDRGPAMKHVPIMVVDTIIEAAKTIESPWLPWPPPDDRREDILALDQVSPKCKPLVTDSFWLDGEWVDSLDGDPLVKPTHWMPKPKMPESEETDDRT